MTETNTGGPASPVVAEHDVLCTGLTKREWFAGQALIGVLSCGRGWTGVFEDEVSKTAYRIADAMIARSEQGGE